MNDSRLFEFETFSLYIVMYFKWLHNFLYCITRDNFFTNLIVHYWYILCCIYRLILALSIYLRWGTTFYVKLLLVQMDHLPKTLLCLMNTVVEQYIEFSWASQEQNGKMKITLTCTRQNAFKLQFL
jgi:hypothetical protein